jgi:hypothetical protein
MDKICVKCNIIQPDENFSKDNYKRDKKQSWCKSCSKKYFDSYGHPHNLLKEREKYHKNPELALWQAAKKRAQQKNISFSILKTDIVIPKVCPVLGIPLRMGYGQPLDGSPSIDRIIPELGYTKGNICVISHRANTLKRDGKLHELEKVVDYIRKWINPL